MSTRPIKRAGSKLRCKMSDRRKSNMAILIAVAVLCLTASGSFGSAGGAGAIYSPPSWELPILVSDEVELPAEPSASASAQPGGEQLEEYGGELTELYINGALHSACRIIGGKVRMTLEEFAEVTGLEYEDGKIDGVELKLAESGEYVEVNGRCLYLEGGLLNVDGAELLEAGESFYNADDVYWLSRIIYSESGNQSLEGMLGVGDVVMNRVASAAFPNSIYEVIFDSRYGVQFSPVETGSIYLEPTEECVIAAKLCLEGYDIVGGALYFVNPDIGVSSWFAQTRTYVTSIGDHDFYA